MAFIPCILLICFSVLLSDSHKIPQHPNSSGFSLSEDAWMRIWQEVVNSKMSTTSRSTTETAPCKQLLLTESKGVVSSPHFPHSSYSNNLDCSYVIRSPDGYQRLKLTFTYFDTEEGSDYVTIYDGPSTEDVVLLEASGTTKPHSVITSGPNCVVRFRTDESVSARGWKLIYTSLASTGPSRHHQHSGHQHHPHSSDSTTSTKSISMPGASRCGGEASVRDGGGIIQSPNHPADYDNNLMCTWNISAPSDHQRILLSFTNFSTEHCCDYVTVYDGPSVASPVLLSVSGSTLPSSIVTTGPHCLIRFKTDGVESSSGWNAIYKIIPAHSPLSANRISTATNVRNCFLFTFSSFALVMMSAFIPV